MIINNYYEQYNDAKQIILSELEETLQKIDIDALKRMSYEILSSNQVFFVGVGRVMLALQAFAKRLAHIGIKTHIVGEITEPAITENDTLIVASGSGTSLIPLTIAQKAKSLGANVIHIGSNPNSQMKNICNLMVRIPTRTKLYLEDEIESHQPMTSLFEQTLFILGDIVAMIIIQHKKIDIKLLWQYHANLE